MEIPLWVCGSRSERDDKPLGSKDRERVPLQRRQIAPLYELLLQAARRAQETSPNQAPLRPVMQQAAMT